MRADRTFHDLCRCLRGDLAEAPDWFAIVELANRTLTTPFLIDLARRHGAEMPADVIRLVETMFARNLVRNARLTAQLGETLAALNARGVTPVLLKGAAALATAEPDRAGRRLACDLDLLIAPEKKAETLAALSEIGYRVYREAPDGARRWFVDLGRAGDVGMIDLHTSLPGPAHYYREIGDIRAHCRPVAVGPGAALLPSPVCQALILIVHDQFQDHDYWVGAIDPRHLLDLRDLAADEDFDWRRLASLAVGALGRNAMQTELLALHDLFAVAVPVDLRNRLVPRLQHQRRMLQLRFPALRSALLSVNLVDLVHYRNEIGLREPKADRWSGARLLPARATLQFLLVLARESRNAKV